MLGYIMGYIVFYNDFEPEPFVAKVNKKTHTKKNIFYLQNVMFLRYIWKANE